MNDSPKKPFSAGVRLDCTGCGKSLKVPVESGGKKTRCPHCQQVLEIPLVAEAVTVDEGSAGDEIAWGPTRSPTSSRAFMAVNPLDHLVPGNQASETWHRIVRETNKMFVGQEELLLGVLIAIFSGGHVLIEGVPGLGKTLVVRTLGKVLGCRFGRIQFTADLMPSDITGAPIFNVKEQEFVFRPGPVFSQLLLCDEINRAPAKTHAALLEIMQERNVTMDGKTHELELPFVVLATQNPIESEGTYNLPEAQLDRFMFKLTMDYPSLEQESDIVLRHCTLKDFDDRLLDEVATISSPEEILEIGRQSEKVRVEPRLVTYTTRIVRATRNWPSFHSGASPRAAIALIQGARTLAAFCGRDYVVPDDIVQLAIPALRHRIRLTAEAEVEGQRIDDQIASVIRSIEVPRMSESIKPSGASERE